MNNWTTTYTAIIPHRHESTHTSERAAIRAVSKAEKQHRTNGTVQCVSTNGRQTFRHCVYGFFDVGRVWQ